jgi:segregation and condensation protein A
MAVLINLIKKNKIDVFDIPIGWITERFLEYVDLVREMNLRVAEDFIEMASLLIFIKSRMLLPTEPGEDPREELVERIIEYEKIRAMAKSFERFPVLGRDTFVRTGSAGEEEDDEDILGLCTLFFQLMKSKEERFIVVRDIRPTLEEKIIHIKQALAEAGIFTWEMELEQEARDRVATILAVLEITKLRMAVCSQKRPFGTIILKRK